MPNNNSKDFENYVVKTANRLRLMQVDLADQSDQTRTEYLCEEIERALKKVLPAERNKFLKRIMARFPAWHDETQPVLERQERESACPVDNAKLKNADFLIHKLLEIAPSLSGDEKDAIAKSLQQAGLGQQLRQSIPKESLQDLKAQLGIGGRPSPDAGRLMELLALVVHFACTLEPLVWKTWRELSPQSSIRPTGTLRNSMGQLLYGDRDRSRAEVDYELKRLKQLIAAIVTASGRVGGQFARQHLSKFSPSEIEAFVDAESERFKDILKGPKARCWDKYKQLAEALTEDSIETEIRQSIVSYVVSLVKETDRRR